MKTYISILLLIVTIKTNAQVYIGLDLGAIHKPVNAENTAIHPVPAYLPMINLNVGYQKTNLLFTKSIALLESSFRTFNNPSYFGLRAGIGYNIGYGFSIVGLCGGYYRLESTEHTSAKNNNQLVPTYGIRAFWKNVYVELSQVESTNYSIGVYAFIKD